ncbi:BsuBI/PstI family type II restriction endonuclease [Olsenella sp. Marseille-P4559]|uniref:BsuBI/PstI family type II restriction endonuclease n=1 Tax=Olsenella sp. Marseille-P4559 TaxID=2364795 RepID=UPI001A91018F|nr:BsuBI/PstI family type II restriction endonuclease [Olsenella sp. Marseille-P4559]
MSIGPSVSVEGTRELLRDLGMDDERSNERSAMVLLALAHLKPGDDWRSATNGMYGIRTIMDRIAEAFGVEYKPNTREKIRRFTLHQFVQVGIIEENADDPTRPINSPKWNYRLTFDTLDLVTWCGTSWYPDQLEICLEGITTWVEYSSERREMAKVPVTLPDGTEVKLSAGGQNMLIKAMVEEFCPRFAPGGKVLYVGDTSKVDETVDAETLERIGVKLLERGKEPDLIVWREDKGWLYLMEACSTHGPVDVTRKNELIELFGDCGHPIAYVSCFPSRKVMQDYLGDLAWETEAWCADTPDHMIHLDGGKFMGSY